MASSDRPQLWTKDPDAELDWIFDWTDWLADNETITASAWTVASGLTLGSVGAKAPSFTGTETTAWFSGGSVGTPYTVSNRITTNQGRTDERTITIRVVNR